MAEEAKSLEDIKKVLYKTFNYYAKKAEDYVNYDDHYTKFAGKLGEFAEKIAAVEQAIAMNELLKRAAAEGRDVEVDLDKRSIRSVTPPAGAKVAKIG